MTRILSILPPWPEKAFVPHVPAGLDRDTEVIFREAPACSSSSTSAHDWVLADLAVLAAGQTAEDEGFDAVCVGDFGDYGIGALRSVLSIPVIGAGRSTMLYALTLGSRFSILVSPPAYRRAKKLVGDYALDRQCASVRIIESTGQEGDTLFASGLATARLCLEEDGADVLCLASVFESELATRLAALLPVPVIEASALVYKLAETCLGLALGHSRRTYPEPLVRKPALISGLIGTPPARTI